MERPNNFKGVIPPQWLVIGISGITCSGKTTLALNLHQYFMRFRCAQLWHSKYMICEVQIINQDHYFLPMNDLRHKWMDTMNAINFEVVTALDMKKMLSDIAWTMKGRYLAMDPTKRREPDFVGEIPTYHPSFEAATRLNILIIEGFLIFNQSEMLEICHIKFHLHLPYEKCFARRKERRYDPPDRIGYFEMCVWPHYVKNFAEYRDRKDVMVLNGESCADKLVNFVAQQISGYLNNMTEPCLMDE